MLLQTAAGNEQAFAQLFNTYHHLLGGFIFKLTESELLTQEIVQDVFLKIWLQRQSLTSVANFKAYLFTIARNHAFNCLKQVARENTRKKEWVNTVLQQAISDTDNSTVDRSRLVEEAVALLPPQQKKVYELGRNEGLRHDEIARKLNISLETVKKHMVLALRFLKHHLRTHTNFCLVFFTALFAG